MRHSHEEQSFEWLVIGESVDHVSTIQGEKFKCGLCDYYEAEDLVCLSNIIKIWQFSSIKKNSKRSTNSLEIMILLLSPMQNPQVKTKMCMTRSTTLIFQCSQNYKQKYENKWKYCTYLWLIGSRWKKGLTRLPGVMHFMFLDET